MSEQSSFQFDRPRKGAPRLVGMKPTKRYWTEEERSVVFKLVGEGFKPAQIAKVVARTPNAVHCFLNKGKAFPCRQDIPLADKERGLTSKRCRKCGLEKPLDDFYTTKMNGSEKRWPYCKPCDIARLADRREKGLHLEKMRRHTAKFREQHPDKDAVNKIFNAAVAAGKIIRPEICDLCGGKPPRNRLGRSNIQGHHDDYSKPLEVRWFCHPCHVKHHRSLKNVG